MLMPPVVEGCAPLPVQAGGKVRCKLCCLKEFCEPEQINADDISYLRSFVMQRRVRAARGDQLYRQGEAFRALFAVHTGSFKTSVTAPDGTERVTGFAFAGDLMGLEAIDSGHHGDRAVALEDSGACLLPWERVQEAAAQISMVSTQMMRMLSREIARDHRMGMMLGHGSAEERFAAFLLSLSRRFASRGFDGSRFRLPMSRPDIGSFLGLSAETVSRLFTRFRDQELLRASGREIELLRPDALQALVGAP